MSGTTVSRATTLIYTLPGIGVGLSTVLLNLYFLKFATDVLGVRPDRVGWLLAGARIWDAVSDPAVGYLSDRTQIRLGRRRPWILAGIFPMAAAFVMLWRPPELHGPPLELWLFVALLVFYTGVTMVEVPHAALGAELSDDYHERTRIFGWRRLALGAGALAAAACLQAFESSPDPREIGRDIGWIGALGILLITPLSLAGLSERTEYRDRARTSPVAALEDIWQNPHARVLLSVYLFQQCAIAALMAALPFFSTYVLDTPGATAAYVATLVLASLAGVPLWLRLAPSFDKRPLLQTAMAGVGLVLAALTFVPKDRPSLVFGIAAAGGLIGAGADVLGPSIQADIVDYDEYRTGERKEGAYFAILGWIAKVAAGLGILLVGVLLELMGFIPNAAQPESVIRGLRALTGLLPALLYVAGALLFLRFRLGRDAHRQIRQQLQARRRAGSRPSGAQAPPAQSCD